MSQPRSRAEGARNLCQMRKAELMKHAEGPIGNNVYRSMEEVRRACAERAQSLAGPVVGGVDALPQPAPSPSHPSAKACATAREHDPDRKAKNRRQARERGQRRALQEHDSARG